MRVSDSIFDALARRGIQAARSRLVAVQEQATTGLRVNRVSDDPVASARAQQESERLDRAQANVRAATAGEQALASVDLALEGVGDLVARAQELTIQASTDTMSASDRRAIGVEVAGLRAQILALGNATHEGHYVFAGYCDSAPAFDATGAFVGDGNVREVEVAPGVRLPAAVSAQQAFGGGGSGVDILAQLDTLATALATNDVATIRGSLDPLGVAVSQVAGARAEVGAKSDSLSVARSVAERSVDRARAAHSGLVEADIFDIMSELARAENALEVATKVASRVSPPAGLLNGG